MKKLIALLFFVALLLSVYSVNTINAATSINGPDTIHKEANQVFTINDLLKLYEHDVLIQSDGFTGYGNIPGDYIITIKQGLATKDVTISVVENWDILTDSNDVLFVADKKDIYVSNDRELSIYEIIFYIYNRTGFVDTSYNFVYEELNNEYHNNFIDGVIPENTYNLDFRLTYYSGNQASYSGSIRAIELPELNGTVLEPPPTTMDKIIKSAPLIIVIAIIYYVVSNKKRKRGYNI